MPASPSFKEDEDQHHHDSKRIRRTEDRSSRESAGGQELIFNGNNNNNSSNEQEPIPFASGNLTLGTFLPLPPNLKVILKAEQEEPPIQETSALEDTARSSSLRAVLLSRGSSIPPTTRISGSSPSFSSGRLQQGTQSSIRDQTGETDLTLSSNNKNECWYHTATLFGQSLYLDRLILEQQRQHQERLSPSEPWSNQSNDGINVRENSLYVINLPDVTKDLWELALGFAFRVRHPLSDTKRQTANGDNDILREAQNPDVTQKRRHTTSEANRMDFPELVRPTSTSFLVRKNNTPQSEENDGADAMTVHQAAKLAPFYDNYGFVRAKQLCDEVIASYLARFQDLCQRQQAYEWEQYYQLKDKISPLSTTAGAPPQLPTEAKRDNVQGDGQTSLPSPPKSPIRTMLQHFDSSNSNSSNTEEPTQSSENTQFEFSTDTVSAMIQCCMDANLPVAQEQARSFLKQVFFQWQDFHQGHIGPAMFTKEQVAGIHPFLIEFVENEPSCLDTLHPGVGHSYTMEEFKSPLFPRIFVTDWRLQLAQDTLLRHGERRQILQNRSRSTNNLSSLALDGTGALTDNESTIGLRSFTQLLMTGITIESQMRDENYQNSSGTHAAASGSSGEESSVESTDELWFHRDSAYNIWQCHRTINLPRQEGGGGVYQPYSLIISRLEDAEDWRIEAESHSGSDVKLLWHSFCSSNLQLPPKSLWKRVRPSQSPEIQGLPKIEYVFGGSLTTEDERY